MLRVLVQDHMISFHPSSVQILSKVSIARPKVWKLAWKSRPTCLSLSGSKTLAKRNSPSTAKITKNNPIRDIIGIRLGNAITKVLNMRFSWRNRFIIFMIRKMRKHLRTVVQVPFGMLKTTSTKKPMMAVTTMMKSN